MHLLISFSSWCPHHILCLQSGESKDIENFFLKHDMDFCPSSFHNVVDHIWSNPINSIKKKRMRRNDTEKGFIKWVNQCQPELLEYFKNFCEYVATNLPSILCPTFMLMDECGCVYVTILTNY